MFRKTTIALALAGVVALGGCQRAQEAVQRRVDQTTLGFTVGKPYQQIASMRKTTLEGMFDDDRAYGELFASQELSDGTTLYRHLDRYESGGTTTSVGGIFGSEKTNYAYRLLYFKVDDQGVIRDYANGFLHGEATNCVSWVGGIFRKCEDPAALRTTVELYDSLVKTSDGLPLSAWLSAPGTS